MRDVPRFFEFPIARSNNDKEIVSLQAAAEYFRGDHKILAGMVFTNGELIDL
jgi:hypothetical protein